MSWGRSAWLVLAACGTAERSPAPAVELTALAASSLTDVLPEVAEAWRVRSGVSIVWSFDSSARLVKQVAAGAPGDLLFTADRETLDVADRRGLLLVGTRRDLLGNTLVAIVPEQAMWTPQTPAELASPQLRHLALAGEAVPAGRYARAALGALGLWGKVAPRVVEGENVRTTLAWVSRGEAEVGLVYGSDALAVPEVRVAFVVPGELHPPIVFPAAVMAVSAHREEAESFLTFCASFEGMALFRKAGFSPPPPP